MVLLAFCIFAITLFITIGLFIHDRGKLALAGAVLCALSFIAFAFTTTNEDRLNDEENYVDVTACEVIGSAVDQTRNKTKYRKIYKCPDGALHIR